MNTNELETLRSSSQHGGTLSHDISHETAFTIFSVIEITTGSFLNGFVIFVLFFNHRLLELPANVVLLSLVISDFFACSIVLPYHLYEILHGRETVVHQAFLLFAITVGMFGTVLLTADRFMAIILPLRYRLLVTTSKTRFVVIVTWFISFVHSSVFYIAVRCQVMGLRYFLSLVKFAAVVTILVLYGVIFRAACRQIKRIQDRNKALRSVGFVVFKRTLKSAKTSGSVVLFFAVTYLPLCINSIVHESRSVPMSIFNQRSDWFLALVYLNCSINPMLYCAFSENFRAIIGQTLHRVCGCVCRDSFERQAPSNRRSASSFHHSEQLTCVVEMTSSVSVLSIDKTV